MNELVEARIALGRAGAAWRTASTDDVTARFRALQAARRRYYRAIDALIERHGLRRPPTWRDR